MDFKIGDVVKVYDLFIGIITHMKSGAPNYRLHQVKPIILIDPNWEIDDICYWGPNNIQNHSLTKDEIDKLILEEL